MFFRYNNMEFDIAMKFKFSTLIFTLFFLINSKICFSQNLFGHELFENANDFIELKYLDKNKVKDIETIDGYYRILIENEYIRDPTDFIQMYLFIIDEKFKIHHISGKTLFQHIDACLELQKSISSLLEKELNIKFKLEEIAFNKTKAFRHYSYIKGNLFMLQCDDIKGNDLLKSVFTIYSESKEYSNSANKFWKKKILEDKLKN